VLSVPRGTVQGCESCQAVCSCSAAQPTAGHSLTSHRARAVNDMKLVG